MDGQGPFYVPSYLPAQLVNGPAHVGDASCAKPPRGVRPETCEVPGGARSALPVSLRSRSPCVQQTRAAVPAAYSTNGVQIHVLGTSYGAPSLPPPLPGRTPSLSSSPSLPPSARACAPTTTLCHSPRRQRAMSLLKLSPLLFLSRPNTIIDSDSCAPAC